MKPRQSAISNATPVLLVSGGAGFIGGELVRQLRSAGAAVVVVDDLSAGSLARLDLADPGLVFQQADLGEASAWQAALEAFGRIDRVMHLAGTVGVRRVLQDPGACRANHLRMARALVGFVTALDPADRPFVMHASSSEVYCPSTTPLKETHSTLDPTGKRWGQGRWNYATSKLEVEAMLQEAQVDGLALRLFNVVGPGQDGESGMVLPRFVASALAGESLHVHGDGSQVRTFGHVQAVAADLTSLCLRPEPIRGVLNLGGGARTTIAGLARSVLQAAGRHADDIAWVDPFTMISPDFEEVSYREPDLSRARALGLVRSPWTLDRIVKDALLTGHASGRGPRVSARFDAPGVDHPADSPADYPAESPAEQNSLHEDRPHRDPLELGRASAPSPR